MASTSTSTTHRLLGSVALSLLGAAALAACAPGTSDTAPGVTSSGTGGGTTTSSSSSSSAASSASSSSSSSSSGGGAGGGPMSACPPDADGDDIPDSVEGKDAMVDTDGDKTPDYLDLDSDGDSLPDKIEGQTVSLGCMSPLNSDGADQPDWRDLDSDNNGLPDANEVYPSGAAYDPQHAAPNPADTDGDKIPDYADPDNDDDSLLDSVELVAGVAVDTDADGLPDLDDVDSDDDTIADSFEGLADPDGDSTPAFRDLDSDGDGRPDKCEAGAGHVLADPPPDTDNDGKYDFLDLDSDADGLPDAVEDANLDCVVDPGETDPLKSDTDGDGTSDFIETVLASDPLDPLQTPGTLGKYYFVLPYLAAPEPAVNVVALHTDLAKGDVAFVVDTTSSMGGEIQNLKTGLGTLIQNLKVVIPDLAVGIAGHDDFPELTYGAAAVDKPFYVAGANGFIGTDLASNLASVLALNVHDGGDLPESQIAAYDRALTDYFLIWDTGTMPPSGAPGGTSGSMHFRDGALPVIVGITDAPFHEGRKVSTPAAIHDKYVFDGAPPFPTPTIDKLVTDMNALGARYLGISASNGVRTGGDPYEDMAYLADHVQSYVSPKAFGGVKCATGVLGSLGPLDGPMTADDPSGTCRLIFDITQDGSGMTATVQSGIVALLKSVHLDIRPLAAPDPNDPIDAVDTFVQSIAVNASGGPDAQEPANPCVQIDPVNQRKDVWTGPKGLVKVQDGIDETALAIMPTQKICFTIIPIQNSSVPQDAMPHVFKAILTLKGKNGAAPAEIPLGQPREIAFIVPPAPQ